MCFQLFGCEVLCWMSLWNSFSYNNLSGWGFILGWESSSTSRSDSGSHDPIQKRFLIYIFSPINSSAVQIHLYNFTSEPKLQFICFLFIVGISVCQYCHLKNRGVNLHWFHDSIQLRLSLSTQYHDASHSQFSILLHMATFSYKFYINLFCAKMYFIFFIIQYKQAT